MSDDETGLSAEERAAIKQLARERRKPRATMTLEEQEQELLDAIAEIPDDEQTLARRIHAIIGEVAPQLTPRTFYGMPAWARDGKVPVFLQPATKFRARYSTLGFQDVATLDDGDIWPLSFAIPALTPLVEQRVAELVRRATA